MINPDLNFRYLLKFFTNVISFILRCGGLVLGNVVDVLSGFVVFQPIINGIGGNLVSIQSSRISTMLHATSVIGIIPPHTKILASPWKAIIKGCKYSITSLFIRLKIYYCRNY